MKNWNVWEWCCFIAILTAGIVEVMYFLGMFILRQETNASNIELRQQLLGIIQFQVAQVMAIIGIVVYAKYKRDDENKKNQ